MGEKGRGCRRERGEGGFGRGKAGATKHNILAVMAVILALGICLKRSLMVT